MPTLTRVRRPWEAEPKPKNESRGGNVDTQFYRRAPWRNLRASILRDEPLCRQCVKEERVTSATMVDHVKPIRFGGAPLDPRNCQPLCGTCHARKSSDERKGIIQESSERPGYLNSNTDTV